MNRLPLFILQQVTLAIIDLTGSAEDVERDLRLLQPFYGLSQHINWVFLIPEFARFTALQVLLRSDSVLLPNTATLDEIKQNILHWEGGTSHLGGAQTAVTEAPAALVLTLSERQVLRLMAKGWSINQISGLLKKSNKTVSAQKNSAMRRLALRSNAEMYAWINSPCGMRELNL